MIPYTDMHCDTLMEAYRKKADSVYDLPDLMLDVKRLWEKGALAQFFAIFMLPESARAKWGEEFPKDRDYIEALLRIHENTLRQNAGIIAGVHTLEDYIRNKEMGRISAFLSLEDGRAVDGKMENLEWLYGEGIRMVALTWNFENCFGYPNSKDVQIMHKGLKPFGAEAVGRMNELGMVVDVSHLSDGGFWDVVKMSKKPFVASHSNCRAIAAHPRNLTDEMIRALGNKGGVMGLNFYGSFLNEQTQCEESYISQMIKHLKHMISVGGSDIAAIGTDFDGISGSFEIADVSGMHLLFDAMEKEGFGAEQIEKIAYKNVERVLKEVL